MCYNYNVSIVSFGVAIISSIFAIYFNQPILGSLVLCYGLMQLSETFIWKGIDTNNTNINKIGTKIGKYTLPLHNVAIAIGIIIAYWSDRTKITTWIPLIIGIMFYIGVLFRYSKQKDLNDGVTKSCSTNNSCVKGAARLQWPYNHRYYALSYTISVLLLFLYVKPLKSSISIFVFFTSTWLITMYLGKRNYKIQGSFWCWSAAIFIPLLVIFNTVITRNVPNLKS